MKNIPTPETITAEWLTARLREAGHGEAQVRGFTQQRFGTGQVGKCIRFELDLAAGGVEVPRSLVGKFPSDNEVSREGAVALRIYSREVMFYRELAPRVSIAIPRCYYADIIDEGPEFLILMEDLHPAEQGDQLSGCSVEVARTAVLELVGLQAPTWCDKGLEEQLAEPPDGFFADMHARYNEMLPGFLDRYASRLAADEVDIIARMGESRSCPVYQPTGTPFCLEHRDYRLDNLLIDERTTPPKVTVVDWQGLKVGRPLNDVALCIAGGLDPRERAKVEQDIVRDYHTALLQAGIKGFDWPACWHEYRRSAFAGFGLTIISAMVVEQTARGDDMFVAMAHRYARHALDLGADKFL
ncbi:MAG: DUF1679 domain-containing protein [Gammaproteobacteria bacterium]|nr:MAG: DUF1679 domain-containing protein [Gammaproteobacteria bacterium]